MTSYPLTWLADVLRAEGCRVIEESGWKTRGRPASSGSFTPRGLVRHWDASTPGSHGAISTVINGVSGTPGPLCSILTCRGTSSHPPSVHVIAAGRANHAGTGEGWGNIPKDQGNTYAVGHEIAQTVDQPWPADQLDQVRRAEAAIMRKLKATPSQSLPSHSEYATGRKIDTTEGKHGQSMSKERATVTDYMEDDDMPTAEEIATAVWKSPVNPNSDTSDASIQINTAVRRTYDNSVYALQKLDAIKAAVDALAKAGTGQAVTLSGALDVTLVDKPEGRADGRAV